MRSRVRWQPVCWVVVRGFSVLLRTLAGFWPVCWQLSQASSRRPMSNGTLLPGGRFLSNALLAALYLVWGILYISPLTHVLKLSLRLPIRRACGGRTCACSRPLDVFTPRYWVASYHSTAQEWRAPRWLTSGYHQSCCVAWPCSHGPRGYSVISLKRCVTLSHPTSMQQSTGTLSTVQLSVTTTLSNVSALPNFI